MRTGRSRVRAGSLGAWALLALASLTGGCGDPFGLPSRPAKRPSASEIAPAKTIFYILPGRPTGVTEAWGMVAQRETNDRKAIFRIMKPGPDESDSAQPELVRKATADGASALLVVPGDSAELPKVLDEARSRGVVVVLIGRTLPAPSGSPPFTWVEPGGFADSARRLLQTGLEDARRAGRPADAPVLLVVDKNLDPTSAERAEALKAAAGSAKVGKLTTLTIDGTGINAGEPPEAQARAVSDAIAKDPSTTVVLAADDMALAAVMTARIKMLGDGPSPYLAGYCGFRLLPLPPVISGLSALAEGRVENLAKMAVEAAFAKFQGETVPDRVVQIPYFHKIDVPPPVQNKARSETEGARMPTKGEGKP